MIPGLTRDQIKKKDEAKRNTCTKKPSLMKKSLWAKLLARIFKIDVSKCIDCGSEMKIISTIKDSLVIEKILVHCGLDPIPPPIATASYKELKFIEY